MSKTTKYVEHARNAKNGQYVSMAYAKSHPRSLYRSHAIKISALFCKAHLNAFETKRPRPIIQKITCLQGDRHSPITSSKHPKAISTGAV